MGDEAHLERIDLQIQILVLDQAVDAFGQDGLQVALSGSSTRVGCHHSRHGRVGSEQ